MSAQHLSGLPKARVVLFGGQGSPSIFSPGTSSTARHDASTSAATAILLSRCHAAFLEEYQCLDRKARDGLGIDISKFNRPEDLLVQANSFRSHGLIESTTICIQHLLHYLAEQERSGEDFSAWTKTVLETTGFCSGLISAIVVASSTTSAAFIEHGVEAFRLAFWIGYRTNLECQKRSLAPKEEASWSLVVLGLNHRQIEDSLTNFRTLTNLQTVRVSAISSAKVISLSGPGPDLSAFRKQLESAAATKFAHVHAWYHAGEQLEESASCVLQDIERRQIKFPRFEDLSVPLRSSHDGQIHVDQTSDASSLAGWLIRHMFIYSVDWVKTCQAMSGDLALNLRDSAINGIEISSFGPSTDSILAEIKDQISHPKLGYLDRSSFKSGEDSGSSAGSPQDIAIVGMGVNFPLGKNQDELWKTLSSGLNAVSEIPGSRFDVSQYYSDDDSHKLRTMPVREGAFLDDVWGFDNAYFNISPREAKSMDPQQRVILSTTQAALEDAGYVADATPSFQRTSVGCYIGIATGDYVDNLKNDIDVFYSPSTLRAFHSGRISYVYKLSGPCLTIDTACSSSLVSVYQACRALQSGDCTSAIAGGANVITSPDMYLGLSRGHFLSPKGGCKPFDEAADGYGRAEGCGIFVLKRLQDAIAENDRIHGVIKGVEANQSGNSHSITHPHSETQMELFRRTLGKTNIDPASISVIEAHGTGTQAGDTREIGSLRAVFEKAHSKANPLMVSSIKGNIGHCEAASGAAGLAKLVLMLRNKQIPLQANLNKLNPDLGDLESAGIVVPRKVVPWETQRSQPRRAMLNNFGAAGSNVALLLEERREPEKIPLQVGDRSAYVFNLSAKNKEALELSVQNYQQLLADASQELRLKDICYTATARRQSYHHRISISCSSVSDLQAKLPTADHRNTQLTKSDGPVVFVFSGQGSLYYGMGTALMKSSSFFRESVLRCDTIVQGLGFPSILAFLCNEKGASPELSSSDEIITSQCACVALEYSLAQLLISWNIIPTCLAGHSLGEYAALAVAGAIKLEDSLYIVAHRARMMVEKCVSNTSGMAACKLSPSAADALIAEHGGLSSMSVACRNDKEDCVVAGSLEQLQSFQKTCSEKRIKSKILDVPYGFHSVFMDPIVEPLENLGKSIKWSNPTIPVASNAVGRLLGPEDFQSDYFAKHARQSVRFSDSVQQIDGQGMFANAICLEIGPHPTTLPMMRNSLDASCPQLPTMQKGKDPWPLLNAVLGEFFTTRDMVHWRGVFEQDVRLVDLPAYPLINTSFAVPYKEGSAEPIESEEDAELSIDTGFQLLPRLLRINPSSEDQGMQFETTMGILGPLISGHNVGGTAICPASVFHELALEAAHIAAPPPDDGLRIVRDMNFTHPLIHEPQDGSKIIRVNLIKMKEDASAAALELKVTVHVVQNEQESLCCTMFVSTKSSPEVRRGVIKNTAMVDRQSQYLLNEHIPRNTFHKKLLYENIFARVVNYSAEYQSLIKLSVGDSNHEAIGSFAIPDTSHVQDFVTPPVFTDTLLHAAGFSANLSVHSDEICICGRVESVKILSTIDYTDRFTVYCTLVSVDNSTIVADSYALNSSRQAVAVIRGMEFKKLRLSSFQRMLHHALPAVAAEKILLASPPGLSHSSSHTSSSHLSGTSTPEPVVLDTRQGIQDTMMETIRQVYGSSDLDSDQPLEALGIDSLMQIEIAAKLKMAFPGKSIDQNDILECETLHALEDLLVLKSEPERTEATTVQPVAKAPAQEILNASKDGKLTNPVQLHACDGTQVPLCLIHDGSGQTTMYSRIGDPGRDVFAFYDPEFPRQASKISSLEQMAEQYSSCLSASRTPSLIIGGWSFGGVVAFQAARLLSKSGFNIKGLVLIDSPYPRKHEPLPKKIVSHVLQIPTSGMSTNQANLATEFSQNAALLAGYGPVDFDPGQHPKIKTVYLRSKETFDTDAACGVRYDWLSDQRVKDTAIRNWESLVGDHIEVLPIPGNHFQPFTAENIAETSAQLKSACRHIEDAGQLSH